MSAERAQPSKRRCVSTACVACRKRKSKCDGNLPSCAACSSVYHTPCVYDPNSDHRRKGVYKKDTDTLRTRNTTLQTLIQAILNYDEADAFELVRQIRSCDDLEDVAASVIAQEKGLMSADQAAKESASNENAAEIDQFESELAGKMSELMLDGSRKFIGGTSNLIFLPPGSELHESASIQNNFALDGNNQTHAVSRWTEVTDDSSLISHLMTMYFTWHYPFFTILAKNMFYRDYIRGVSSSYCSALLVNAMLALGCHFSSWQGAFDDPQNLATAGNHFFKEAKRLVLENDEHENAKLCTVQAFALLSVREAGCGREGKGWVYSGLSFRMAFDLGLNLDSANLGAHSLTDEEIDARRITFWGCYLIDKCWSNYLGRQPQLTSTNSNVPKADVLPQEEIELWSPYTDAGVGHEHTQPSRTRAVALQISKLCEISSDVLVLFYHPTELENPQSKQSELKKLSGVHTRLEAWKNNLPRELVAKDGQLPQVLVMHMLYQLQIIHLYRPFLKYTKANTPLPSHVSPRKICTQAAATVSKLLRMYKRGYGLKQICNIAVYIAHTACTVHLLNLPDKNAQRDVIHGLKNLEEMAVGWLCARRTLRILDISANKWQVELPPEAISIFERTHHKWGSWGSWDQATSPSTSDDYPIPTMPHPPTSPSRFSPSGLPFPHSHTEPIGMGETPMGPQYGPLATVPISFPSMQGMNPPQAQRPEFAPPEPTYLRPQVAYQFNPLPGSVPPSSPHPDNWYDGSGAHMSPQNATPTSVASPVSGYDGTENLVEESHDWWSRNANAYNIGMDGWSSTWNTASQNQPSVIQYQDGNLMSVARPSSSGDEHSQAPVGMSTVGSPDDTTGYGSRWE
ncbi:transcriptional regulator family: Fungal Specific TF [Penicillium psychrosexuale]|uniref:transcriptional regulator family: Fungal Specific TF n=1 Tax=Penicillium psychrosexuale TaxID=1002107 RepID=UPI002544EABE|nr:transcriptional regulator family: Fungal Specific TF [Penicillium psychrosexuale]KAJ5799793.1 transcriptional regulator family: Fungal Specific TF [Penicillium psychrosexuale]